MGGVVVVDSGVSVLVDVAAHGDAGRRAWRWLSIVEMKSQRARRILSFVAILLFANSTRAHEGPPFPIVVDQKVDSYVVSIWTDPDVGTALFFVIVNAPNLPADLRVQIGVQPVTGRLSEVFYPTVREELQGQTQYRAEVHLDAEELWQVRVRLESAGGNAETLATVEATPPGYGRWDLLVYLLPFLAIGVLWSIALVRRIKRRRQA